MSQYKNGFNLPVVSRHDLRVVIVRDLLHGILNYTLEFIPDPDEINNAEQLRQDNTLLLRANDIFQIALIQEKKINLYTKVNDICIRVFSSFDTEDFDEHDYDDLIYDHIKKAFL